MTSKTCVCITVVQLQILMVFRILILSMLEIIPSHKGLLYLNLHVTYFQVMWSNFDNWWTFLRMPCTPINSMLNGWGNSNYTHIGKSRWQALLVFMFTELNMFSLFIHGFAYVEFTLISAYHQQQIFSYYCW